ncbi:hypothetical protein BKH46_07320 [Helicobacter sp. 12S02634-8]|uniref:SPOR domain-containing protein n=1 Tax=Helicobacter sp. 12S02634-8 TaxID=1476199 RepID=UPI000BA6C32B|nr:SPOR domain-containing protein [Helicobacter sp. 12S02634-8]PAF46545.1 hypothetical protein BKH46_07320 [Helicobacter sp. 12S02634-8]
MEDKKELNKILLGEEGADRSAKTKKMILFVVIAIIVVLILLVVVFFLTRPEQKEPMANTDSSIEKMDAMHNPALDNSLDSNDDFNQVPIDDMSKTEEENKFDKIVQDIKSKQLASNPPITKENTQDSKQEKAPSTQTSPIEEKTTTLPNNTQDHMQAGILDHAQNTQAKKPTPSTPKETTTPKAKTAPEAKATKAPASKATTPKTANTATAPKAKAPAKEAKNGTPATAGYYLQVGAFSKTPNKEFLNKISKYSYRTQSTIDNNQTITKYLIGPYPSRAGADKDIAKITADITKPIHIQVK